MNTAITDWKARVISGAAGGTTRDAIVNLRVTCKADTVASVGLLADAAPDLLAALEDCLLALNNTGFGDSRAVTQAHAAIANAKGEK